MAIRKSIVSSRLAGSWPGKADDEMDLHEKWGIFKVGKKRDKRGLRAPLLTIQNRFRHIDKGEVEAAKTGVVHEQQGRYIQVSGIDAVHGGQSEAPVFEEAEHLGKGALIKVEHVILEIDSGHAEAGALRYLFIDARQCPPPVRDRRLPAEAA